MEFKEVIKQSSVCSIEKRKSYKVTGLKIQPYSGQTANAEPNIFKEIHKIASLLPAMTLVPLVELLQHS